MISSIKEFINQKCSEELRSPIHPPLLNYLHVNQNSIEAFEKKLIAGKEYKLLVLDMIDSCSTLG